MKKTTLKYSDISVQPLRGSRYKVLKEVEFWDIVVPVGHRTNGADIPRILWGYIPPYWSDALPAVIVHDYMCDKAKTKDDYKKADLYFGEILKLLKVEKSKARNMSIGVSFSPEYIRKYD